MNYLIRKKELKDCQGIAHTVTIAWNETYQGIVPDWFLEELKIMKMKELKCHMKNLMQITIINLF